MQAHFKQYPVSHLLLVEDNQEDRDHLKRQVHDVAPDCTVVAVADGPSAVKQCQGSAFDCVILDYRLEAENGLTVLNRLKKIHPFVPIIMLTGQGNEELAAQSIKVGASDYLVKDRLTSAQLRSAIEQSIHRAFLEKQIAEQEEERRQFISTLVHDLKAPMNNIVQLGDYAATEADAGNISKMRELLTWQRDVSWRARDLIHTLETYSLLDGTVNFEPVDLAAVAQAAKDNLSELINTRDATVLIGVLPTISGHKPQLLQLFQNLIQNGLKYNRSERPRVIVEAEPTKEDWTRLVISDNGIGIEAEFLNSIFMPLKRLWTQSDFEGTGLGLAICKKIVERHAGSIVCTSEPGIGSRFLVTLPRNDAR